MTDIYTDNICYDAIMVPWLSSQWSPSGLTIVLSPNSSFQKRFPMIFKVIKKPLIRYTFLSSFARFWAQNLGSEFQGQIDENPLILNDCSRFLKKLCRYLENLFRRIFKHFILLFQGHRN